MIQIDAHQHVWNLERHSYPWLDAAAGPICRTIEAAELEPLIRAAGIDKTVLVQAMNSYEDTDYMLQTADRYPWVGAVVGWVPLNIPGLADAKLRRYAAHPRFKGVRHLIHDERNADWIVQSHVIEGLRVLASYGMTFDLVAVFPDHLRHVPYLAEQVPGLRIVIDHLAKPPIRERRMEPWATQLAEAARCPNVYAKISGLNTAADWSSWSADDIRPYIARAVEVFGAERLMYGSDWPVANLAGDYMRVWEEMQKALADYTEQERAWILGGTAAAFYGIEADGGRGRR